MLLLIIVTSRSIYDSGCFLFNARLKDSENFQFHRQYNPSPQLACYIQFEFYFIHSITLKESQSLS